MTNGYRHGHRTNRPQGLKWVSDPAYNGMKQGQVGSKTNDFSPF
jgi:hypothetical protein